MSFDVIPVALAKNPAFRADVEALLKLSPEALSVIRQAVGHGRDLDEEKIKAIETGLDIKREVAVRLAGSLNYLIARLVSTEASPLALLNEIEEVVESPISDADKTALANVIAPDKSDLEFEASSTAFSYGDTYLSASFSPVFTFGTGSHSERLFSGLAWSITYRSAGTDPKSIALSISTLELRDLAARMLKACEEADSKLASLSSRGA